MAVTMTARWDNAGTVIPVADATYVVAEQPIAEYDNWFNYNIVADIQAVIDDVINKFNANTILKADTDNTPAALVVAEQTIVGRKTGNSIAALIDAEVRTLINVENGATADQTNTEIRDAVEAAADSNTFTDNDHTKLNGIETAATTDQSDAEIRTAVEAAADSNVFTDADHTKLNGIETAATTDQSNAEIRTAVEAAADSNVFTDNDHTKLNGIDSGADVTGTNAPQAHASTHEAGGSDVVSGLLNSSSSVVLNGATVNNVWTDIDLSAVIGSNSALVVLEVYNTSPNGSRFGFRPNGNTHGHNCSAGVHLAANKCDLGVNASATDSAIVVVTTSAAGVIEYICNGQATVITLLSFAPM